MEGKALSRPPYGCWKSIGNRWWAFYSSHFWRGAAGEKVWSEQCGDARGRGEVDEKRPGKHDTEFLAIHDSIKELAIQIINESPNIPSEATFAIKNIESQSFLINFVTSNMTLSVREKQDLLSINVLKDTTKRMCNTLSHYIFIYDAVQIILGQNKIFFPES